MGDPSARVLGAVQLRLKLPFTGGRTGGGFVDPEELLDELELCTELLVVAAELLVAGAPPPPHPDRIKVAARISDARLMILNVKVCMPRSIARTMPSL